jgi:CRISPR-associated protein Cmr5
MKAIEKILPSAIQIVEDHVLVASKVPKEFNGYISSFGASIITSGLLPTIVFFSQEGRGRGNRTSVIIAIEEIIKLHHPELINNQSDLLNTVKNKVQNNQNMDRLVEKIQDSAIALKLAIRIFPKAT